MPIYNIGKVTVTVYDPAGHLVKTLEDKCLCDNSNQIQCSTWECAGIPDGVYTIIASAEDLTGVPAVNTLVSAAYVDSTPPVISNLSLSRAKFSPGTNDVSITFEASDNLSSITTDIPNKINVSVNVFDPSGDLVKTLLAVTTLDSGTTNSLIWDGKRDNGMFAGTKTSSDCADGTYTFKISAVDVAGNTSEAVKTIVVDTIPPSFDSVSISPSPFSPSGAKPNANISANISDVNNVSWEVQIMTGSNPKGLTGSGNISCSWNGYDGAGNKAVDGAYLCLMTAQDAAGNVSQITSVVTCDTTPPVITETLSKTLLGGTSYVSTIEYNITDSNPGVMWWSGISNESYTGTIDGLSTDEAMTWDIFGRTYSGDYQYIVLATDEAGNTAISTEIISVDNTAPAVEITSPSADSHQKSVFNIYGSVTDAHPGTWALYYDGGTIASGEGTKHGDLLASFDSSALNGQFYIHLVATDEVGNTSSISDSYITIDNDPPVVTNVTGEAGVNPITSRNYFNPYTDGNIEISVEVSDLSYPINVSAEVWTGSTFIASLEGQSLGLDDIGEFFWGGTNEAGQWVNEGDYQILLYLTDAVGNTTTCAYAVKLIDDQQLTGLNGMTPYSHDPDLIINGANLGLKYINGISFGGYTVQAYAQTGDEAYQYRSISLIYGSTVTISSSFSDNGPPHNISRGILNDSGTLIFDANALGSGDYPVNDPVYGYYPGGRYYLFAGLVGAGNAWIKMTVSQPDYNNCFTDSTSNLFRSPTPSSINELETYEKHASCSSGNCDHCVWSAKSDSLDGYFNNYEIVYNQYNIKSDGTWDWRTISTKRYYTYSYEIRLSNADGDSINPSIAAKTVNIMQLNGPGYSYDEVYVVWEDYRDGKGEIFFNKSTDSGSTWLASEVKLPITSTGNCMMPSIACSGGWLHVAYVDDKNGNKELYYMRSNDGGTSWQGPVRITITSFEGCNASSPSIAANDEDAYVAWEDTRTGTSEIWFQKIPSNFAPLQGSTMTTLSIPQKKMGGQAVILSGTSSLELLSPINGATVDNLRPTFSWYGLTGINNYKIECATSSDEASLSGTMDYYMMTLADSSGLKPLCSFTQDERFMGLDESDSSRPYWYWRVEAIGTSEISTSEVASFTIELPATLADVTNWPNPFNPVKEMTKIRYRLGKSADNVTIKIYDITGKLVRELDGTCYAEAGDVWHKYNDVEWDGRNGRGDMVLNGVYPFEVTVDYGSKTITARGKIAVLK